MVKTHQRFRCEALMGLYVCLKTFLAFLSIHAGSLKAEVRVFRWPACVKIFRFVRHRPLVCRLLAAPYRKILFYKAKDLMERISK